MQAGNGMFYYTYVLKSNLENELYIGWTKDLRERLKQHNKGLIRATKSRRPFNLIYYEACLNQSGAIAKEKQLKTGFGRAYLKRRLII